jgi:hypothetical protein
MDCKECLEMLVNIAIIGAAIVAIVALYQNRKTNILQSQILQANMFGDITKRINDLLYDMPKYDKLSDNPFWHTMVLNAFDYYCFYVNHKSLSFDMGLYYKKNIIMFCDTLREKCPKTIDKLQPNTLTEMRSYYKKHTGKEVPF